LGYKGGDAKTVLLKVDNQVAIKIATNPVNHPGTKYIKSDYYYIRELISEFNLLRIEYVPTVDMLTNGLTKALGPTKFHLFKTELELAPSV